MVCWLCFLEGRRGSVSNFTPTDLGFRDLGFRDLGFGI